MLDFTNIDAGSFSPLKPGLYQFMIEELEVKKSMAGNDYINLKLKCTNPDNLNRIVWDTIQHGHPDAEVKKIAAQKIKQILLSMGSNNFSFQDWNDLMSKIRNGIVWAVVGVKHEQGYEDKNNVKYYKVVDKSVGPNEDFQQPGSNNNIPF